MKKTENKNSSKQNQMPLGRTIKTKDIFLPIEKGKGIVSKPKDKRWIAVIDFNDKGELAVVKLTTEKQSNTSKLSGYKKGNGKTTYFKHFVEIKDSDGNAIRIDGVRFIANPKKYDLNIRQANEVRKTVLNHTRQSTENKKKIAALKNGNKKKKQD
ncbi:MAG: hypothetical protein HFK02_04660 [Clostridia bacterium]|jgi:hypothetical protein|nr:hypothetical protein [Clostridia bacterium]